MKMVLSGVTEQENDEDEIDQNILSVLDATH